MADKETYKRLHKRCETVIKHGDTMRNLCKGPYAICEQRRPGPIPTFVQYDPDLLRLFMYSVVPSDFLHCMPTMKTAIGLHGCRLNWDSLFVNYIATLFIPHSAPQRVPLMISLRV